LHPFAPVENAPRPGWGRCRRSAAVGDLVEGYRLADFGVSPGEPGAEVTAFEPVAVAFEAEGLGVVDERSIIAVAAMSSPKISLI
jgi:hypothetical protein